MKIVLLADLHGNMVATKAIEREIDKIGPDDDEDEIIGRVADGIRALCRYAEGTGVPVVQEVHGSFNLARRVLGVAEKVRMDNFGLLWDVAHSDKTYGDDYAGFYAAIRPFIRHVHFKDHRRNADGTFTLCPTGEGDIPLLDIARSLRASGYAGWLTFEWEKRWHPEIAGPEIAIPQFARFIRETWDAAS